MIDFNKLKSKGGDYNPVEKLGFIENLLIFFATALSNKTAGLKLTFYQKFINFIGLISLYIIEKNGLRNILNDLPRAEGNRISGEGRIFGSLVFLLYHFEILKSDKRCFFLSKKFCKINNEEREAILSAVDESVVASYNGISGGYRGVLQDFLFIRELISRYRNRGYEFRNVPQGGAWKALIDEGGLDYEVRLCETLFNLAGLVIPQRIASPFDGSYYTESGRNAFNNYTKDRFGSIVRELGGKRKIQNVLDIGCGYGDYLNVVNDALAGSALYGIELQKKVYKEVRSRFLKRKNIHILNINYFDFKPEVKFDLILLNYVLFYFTYAEKKRLFRRAASMLSESGSILVCQYFQGIERMKRELARTQKDLSLIKKIEMFYSNKILYANTLWNDTADIFSESAMWNELMEILDANNLEVNSLTNADKFYFSLFVEIKHKK